MAERAEQLAGMSGVAAGSAPESNADDHAPTHQNTDPNLSFMAQRAEELMKLANDYAEFAQEYPNMAAALLPAISVGAKAMMGGIAGSAVPGVGTVAGAVTGLTAGVVLEVQGWFVGELAGDTISALVQKGIGKVSDACKAFDRTLTDQQAQALGAAAVLGGMAGFQGRTATKEAIKMLGSLKHASTAATKPKLDNISLSKSNGNSKPLANLPDINLPTIRGPAASSSTTTVASSSSATASTLRAAKAKIRDFAVKNNWPNLQKAVKSLPEGYSFLKEAKGYKTTGLIFKKERPGGYDTIRIVQGKSDAKYSSQQKDYVVHIENGNKFLDLAGNKYYKDDGLGKIIKINTNGTSNVIEFNGNVRDLPQVHIDLVDWSCSKITKK